MDWWFRWHSFFDTWNATLKCILCGWYSADCSWKRRFQGWKKLPLCHPVFFVPERSHERFGNIIDSPRTHLTALANGSVAMIILSTAPICDALYGLFLHVPGLTVSYPLQVATVLLILLLSVSSSEAQIPPSYVFQSHFLWSLRITALWTHPSGNEMRR